MNYAVLPETFIPPVSFNTVQSNKVILQDGSASQPSLTFLSDQDTGLFRQGVNTMSLTSNSTEIARCNSVVNILKLPVNLQSDFSGTPSNAVSVSSDGSNTAMKLKTSGSGGSYIQFENPSGDPDLRIAVSPLNDVILSSKENIKISNELFVDSVILCRASGDGIVILNNTITNYQASNLRAYEEKTYSNVSLSGFSVPTTCDLRFTRVGDIVNLTISGVNSTTDGALVGVSVGSFEEPFRPSSTVYLCVPVTKENGVNETGIVEVRADGSLVFGYTPSSGWGVQPNSGWDKCCVSYHV